MNIRRSLLNKIALIVCACFSVAAMQNIQAQWPTGNTVDVTYHNLRVPANVTNSEMAGLVKDYGEVCVYCHSPHGGRIDRPLWNRPIPGGHYRMYDPEELDMIADVQPTGNSLSCLSCHDGTIGLDEIINPPNNVAHLVPSATSIEECADCHDPEGGHNFEGVYFKPNDFDEQHPISILYDPSRDPNFNSAAEIQAAGFKLYEGKVQCITCHEPHSQQYQPFLRVPNTGQNFCMVCHRTQPNQQTVHNW